MTTTTTTTTTLRPTTIKETVLIGDGNNSLFNFEYSKYSSDIVRSLNVGSRINGIVYGEDTNKAYVSTSTNLYSYGVNYFTNSNEIYRDVTATNTDGTIISTYRKSDNSLWGVQSYNGKVLKMSPIDFSVIKTYTGFDAPNKIRYSAYHNAYFVSGTHILWKIDDTTNTVTHVYQINNYEIKDFDISENGLICILFRGIYDDIIRIVKKDLYSFVLDKKVLQGTASFCKYCNAGRFYILQELNTQSTVYSVLHLLYDTVSNSLNGVSSNDALSFTTTTTTLGTTSKAVQITNPVSLENIQVGQQYDIKWISSKSLNDSVKIELYNSDVLYETLSEKTTNTGIFSWNVSSNIEDGDEYKIKITWLAANTDSNNYDISPMFSILKNVTTTTTSTTTKITQHAIGVDYSPASDYVFVMLSSGLYTLFSLSDLTTYSLLQSGVYSPLVIAARSMVINGAKRQVKFRIFVGSQIYASDRWDSGIINSELKSCYYGGGNNLIPGQKYYVHIQVCSEKEGWGELQISEFVFPK